MRWNQAHTRSESLLGRLVIIVLAVAGLAGASPALAQREVNIDLGRIGLGAYSVLRPSMVYRPIDVLSTRPGGDALGMGGAYTASASGLVALGWNPAGLADLEGTSFSFDGYSRGTSGKVPDWPESLYIPQTPALVISTYRVNMKGGFVPNFLAAGTPLWSSGERRAVAAFSWRRYAETAVPEEVFSELTQAGLVSFPLVLSFDRSETGSVEAFSPALAFRFGPAVSLGATMNILDGGLRSNTDQRLTIVGAPLRGTVRVNSRYSGLSPDFGGRVSLGPSLAFGAHFTPGYNLKVRGGTFYARSFSVPPSPTYVTRATLADYDLEVPAAVAAGIAYRATPRLLLAADVTRQPWSEAKVVYREYTDPVTGAKLAPPDSISLPLADVSTFHVGAEYQLFRNSWGDIPVRIGFHSDPLGFRNIGREDVRADTVETDTGPTVVATPTGTYHGSQPKSNALSFGASLVTPGIRFDLGIERVSYDLEKWFFEVPWDPIANPAMRLTKVKRSVSKMRLSATYNF